MRRLIPFAVIAIVLAVLIQMKKAAERPREYDPEWYRLSRAIDLAVKEGLPRTGLVIGNSYTYTAVDPEILKDRDTRYFVFARGATPATDIMDWLEDRGYFPRVLLAELNAWHSAPRPPSDFDVIAPPAAEDSFARFKAALERELRYGLEKRAALATYAVDVDEARNRWRVSGPLEFLVWLLFPDPDKVRVLHSVAYRHHENGFEEDVTEYTPERRAERTRRQTGDFRGYLEGIRRHAASEAGRLADLAEVFVRRGTRVIFFRLPKDRGVISAENDLTPEIFVTARSLAEVNPSVAYLDFTTENDLEEFTELLSDGAHWTAAGARLISSRLARAIGGRE